MNGFVRSQIVRFFRAEGNVCKCYTSHRTACWCNRFAKLQKFQFTRPFVLIFLKCVRDHDALRTGHGEEDKAFVKVRDALVPLIPTHLWIRQQNPSVKTLRDKFRSFTSARKYANTAYEHSFCITEIVSGADQLQDHTRTRRKRRRNPWTSKRANPR